MKFLVTYQLPHAHLDDWLKLPEEERKKQELEMQSKWNTWMEDHHEVLVETAGVGRPKRVSPQGVEDARNDIMMYSFVEASSLEAAADMFRNHPHFGIPGGWIEVMSVNTNVG